MMLRDEICDLFLEEIYQRVAPEAVVTHDRKADEIHYELKDGRVVRVTVEVLE